MSISAEISRLQQAKSDLATSIANKGVTVPAATTIDGYAALVDQIQTGGGTPLPTGAVEVEYLQGDNSAFIDTGIKASSDIEFEAGIYISPSLPTTTTSVVVILGGRVANNDTALTVQYYNVSSSNKTWRWSYNNAAQTVSHGGVTGDYYISNRYNKNTLVVMGANVSHVTCTNSTFSNNYNMYLFAVNTSGTITNSYSSYLRIKACKIYSSGALARDYIPVRVGTAGYLYDKVSGQLFGNANGTGAFTLGPDVV